ncbi:MAG: type II toxin-antitoxin system PemK/MazF family toxin [Stellaceae bacterium]
MGGGGLQRRVVGRRPRGKGVRVRQPAPLAVRRGDIWWVDLDPTRGGEIHKRRPAVVMTADGLNRARRTVVVVPLSTGPEPRPPIVVATPSAGVRAVAVCDQLRAIDKGRLNGFSGRLSTADLGMVEDGIRRILEL